MLKCRDLKFRLSSIYIFSNKTCKAEQIYFFPPLVPQKQVLFYSNYGKNSHDWASRDSKDSTSELPSQPNPLQDNVSLQITDHKLNSKKFLQWSQFVLLVIRGGGKIGYLTGETKRPKNSETGNMATQKLNRDCTADKFYGALNQPKLFILKNSKGDVGCCNRNIFGCWELFSSLRVED